LFLAADKRGDAVPYACRALICGADDINEQLRSYLRCGDIAKLVQRQRSLGQPKFLAQTMEREDAYSGGCVQVILIAQVRLEKYRDIRAGAEIGGRRRKACPAALALNRKLRLTAAHHPEINFTLVDVAQIYFITSPLVLLLVCITNAG
jgi:hypothetical protein